MVVYSRLITLPVLPDPSHAGIHFISVVYLGFQNRTRLYYTVEAERQII